MSTDHRQYDRHKLLASLHDYLLQLAEEGLDGLPASQRDDVSLSRPGKHPQSAATASVDPGDCGAIPTQPTSPSYHSSDSSASAGAVPVTRIAQPGSALFAPYPGLEKTSTLEALRAFIGDCRRCRLADSRTNLVFGVGHPRAELMFVGEAPGADEDARGEPFVGRAGALLTDIIERGMGMTRDQVYICNVIKCRPPNNRNPAPDEVAACKPFLMRQIELVAPKVIVGLGTFAVHALLECKTPISKIRGEWQEVHGVPMMPTFHPAYLLRNPGDKRLVWRDIQAVLKKLGRPVPSRQKSS